MRITKVRKKTNQSARDVIFELLWNTRANKVLTGIEYFYTPSVRKTKRHEHGRHYSLGLGDGDRNRLQPRPISTFCSDDAHRHSWPHSIGRLSRLWCPSRIDWPPKMSVNIKPTALARGKVRAWVMDLDQCCVSLERHVLCRSLRHAAHPLCTKPSLLHTISRTVEHTCLKTTRYRGTVILLSDFVQATDQFRPV